MLAAGHRRLDKLHAFHSEDVTRCSETDEETAVDWEHLCNARAREDTAGHSFTYYIYARYITFRFNTNEPLLDQTILQRAVSVRHT